MSAHDNQQKRGQAAGDQPPSSAPRAPRSMRGPAAYGQGPTGFEDMQYQLEYNRQQPMFGTGANFGGLHDTTAHQAGQRPRAPAPRKASRASSLHRKEGHGPLDVTSGLGASAPSPYSLGAVAENSGDHTPEPKMSAHGENAGKNKENSERSGISAGVGNRPAAPRLDICNKEIPLGDRIAAWSEYKAAESAAKDQWKQAGAPACKRCHQKHAPPCFQGKPLKHKAACEKAGRELDTFQMPGCNKCGVNHAGKCKAPRCPKCNLFHMGPVKCSVARERMAAHNKAESRRQQQQQQQRQQNQERQRQQQQQQREHNFDHRYNQCWKSLMDALRTDGREPLTAVELAQASGALIMALAPTLEQNAAGSDATSNQQPPSQPPAATRGGGEFSGRGRGNGRGRGGFGGPGGSSTPPPPPPPESNKRKREDGDEGKGGPKSNKTQRG